MGIFNGLTGSPVKEGKGLPAPRSGYRRYFYLLWNYFWKFVAVNLLFLVFSIPVVTLPAALCAANRVCICLVRDGHVFLWSEFLTEFKGSFRKSLLPGSLFGFLLFTSYYLLSLGLTNYLNLYGILFNALGLLFLFVVLLWGGYTFVLAAMLDLPAKGILKNAFHLILLDGKCALGVLGMEALMIFLTAGLYPVSLVLLVFCLPGLTQYTLCFLMNDPVEKYILTPWEEFQVHGGGQQEQF